MNSLLATYLVLPLVSLLLIPVVKTYFSRIDMRISNLEQQIKQNMTESEVRQLVTDKLDPLKEDLQEIKASIRDLSKLFILKNKGNRNE